MSYNSLCKTAEYFEDRARRTRHPDKHERLAAIAKKYRLRAEIQRKLDQADANRSGDSVPVDARVGDLGPNELAARRNLAGHLSSERPSRALPDPEEMPASDPSNHAGRLVCHRQSRSPDLQAPTAMFTALPMVVFVCSIGCRSCQPSMAVSPPPDKLLQVRLTLGVARDAGWFDRIKQKKAGGINRPFSTRCAAILLHAFDDV